ncbi:MAG: electron transport complex subunit E [Bacillota bacterium]
MIGLFRDFANGILKENPVFRLVLGMCPVLAVTAAVENGFWMGMAVIFVLTSSNLIIAILRHVIPEKIRIPCFIVVIATFVTMADLVMNAYLPAIHVKLGIFVPLIVVNCIILARAEAFASKRPILNSIADGLGMGIGFTLALLVISSVREILGTANLMIAGNPVFTGGLGFEPARVMVSPPGAFITMGVLLGLLNVATGRGRLKS